MSASKLLLLYTFFLLLGCTAEKEDVDLLPDPVNLTDQQCSIDSGEVCAGDGHTYSNECEAQKQGNHSYESGTCGEQH